MMTTKQTLGIERVQACAR